VHHYTGTQHCSTETVLLIPLIQTNITSQMWPRGGKGENKPRWKNVSVHCEALHNGINVFILLYFINSGTHTHTASNTAICFDSGSWRTFKQIAGQTHLKMRTHHTLRQLLKQRLSDCLEILCIDGFKDFLDFAEHHHLHSNV